MEEDLPPLEDFEDQLKDIKYNKPNIEKADEDYTKLNTRHIQDEQKQKQQMHTLQKQTEKIQKQIQTQNKKDFGGLKKGFFAASNEPKKQKIIEVKPKTKQNPLQFKQVQQAMKMNNYLQQTRNQWMTDNFLNNVTKNQKINKLFTNPQYIKAIDLFKTNPKQAMARYGQNKQFMEGFQQFCKMMGSQFQNLAKSQKKN